MKNFKIISKMIFSSILFSFSFSQNLGYFFSSPSCVVFAKDNKKTEEEPKLKEQKKRGFNVNCSDIEINALNGAVLLDASNDEILYSRGEINRDGDVKVAPMASTTKIMTAIIALENMSVEEMNKIKEIHNDAIMVEGTSMGLSEGDKVSTEDLLYGMLLKSGNDAANEVAVRVIEHMIKIGKIEIDSEKEELTIKECIEKFVEFMNNKAKEIGLKDIKFSSPSGLGPEDILYSKKYNKNETSARDLAMLASYALKKAKFKEICSTPKKTVVIENESREYKKEKRTYYNHNKLIRENSGFYYKYACGVKTGFTKEAGRCLVAAAEKNGITLVAVVLKDKDDWVDCVKLFEYGFSKYEEVDIKSELPEKERIENVKFKDYGKDGKDVFFKVKQDDKKKSLYLRKNRKNKTKVERKIIANPVQFNVKKGENIGKVEYYSNGKFVGESKIFVDEILD